MELPNELMVSVSGVRGRVGEALTPEVVTHFAAAFGAWAREATPSARHVVVARDSRPSGDMFVRAVTSALQSVGCDVVDLGMVPTPTALLAISHHHAAGGIVVTASHNPAQWNALKLASAEGLFLDAEQGGVMRAFLSDRPIPRAGWDATGSVTQDDQAISRHVAAILRIPYLDVQALRRRRFRVAVDAVHGAGGVLLVPVLEALGCEVRGIGMEADGRFSREPEPLAANLSELERLVEETGADIGLGLDPDGDRLSLVSDRGGAVGEDLTLALATALVLRHRKGPVVANFSTSRVVEDVAEDAGVTVVRAPVGEINVARRMQQESAVVGGEGNGGVMLPDVHLTRDAGVAAALVLQLLVETDIGIHEHVARQRRYFIVKEKVPRDAMPMEHVYRTLEARLAAPRSDRQDGLWLSWPEHRKWLHLRPSGTEPVVRMIAEALSEPAARELVELSRLAMLEPK